MIMCRGKSYLIGRKTYLLRANGVWGQILLIWGQIYLFQEQFYLNRSKSYFFGGKSYFFGSKNLVSTLGATLLNWEQIMVLWGQTYLFNYVLFLWYMYRSYGTCKVQMLPSMYHNYGTICTILMVH